jgi:hypothetical protein
MADQTQILTLSWRVGHVLDYRSHLRRHRSGDCLCLVEVRQSVMAHSENWLA